MSASRNPHSSPLALVIFLQAVILVAMPLVQELGYTHEIDDRVLSPLPVSLIAVAKVVSGALQGLAAAILIIPLAYFVPSARPDLQINWAMLLTLAPLAALLCSSLGLCFATILGPDVFVAIFAVLLTPMMWLGATFFPWSALHTIAWVQGLSLAIPLTYVSEGFRAAVTPLPHLSLLVIYPVLCAFTTLLLWQGVRAFNRRILR